MKRILAFFLACIFILTGCTPKTQITSISSEGTGVPEPSAETAPNNIEPTPQDGQTMEGPTVQEQKDTQDTDDPNSVQPAEDYANYTGLNDPKLLQYIEDTVYSELVATFSSEDYIIENVQTIYLSKEYLDEVAYNSQANIFFGYTLAELSEQFQGTKYVFTLDENGETTVKPFEDYDDTYDKIVRNVAIGAGVILLCVTVAVIVNKAGPAAFSMVLSASTDTTEEIIEESLSPDVIAFFIEGLVDAVYTGIGVGIQTQDFEEALKAAALRGSEKFRSAAILYFEEDNNLSILAS